LPPLFDVSRAEEKKKSEPSPGFSPSLNARQSGRSRKEQGEPPQTCPRAMGQRNKKGTTLHFLAGARKRKAPRHLPAWEKEGKATPPIPHFTRKSSSGEKKRGKIALLNPPLFLIRAGRGGEKKGAFCRRAA